MRSKIDTLSTLPKKKLMTIYDHRATSQWRHQISAKTPEQ